MNLWWQHLSISQAALCLLVPFVLAIFWYIASVRRTQYGAVFVRRPNIVRKSHQLILPRDILPPPCAQTERPVFRERR
jgi:hypothetical protein